MRALKITRLIGICMMAWLIVEDGVANCRIVLFIHEIHIVIPWEKLAIVVNGGCIGVAPSRQLEFAEGCLGGSLLHENDRISDIIVVAKWGIGKLGCFCID
jgi:hypothetical protein